MSCALLVAAAACSGPRPFPATDGPLKQPLSSVAPRIDVRSLQARPRLTLIGRSGDPSPSVVVALATGRGVLANTALAALVAERLARAGHHARGRGDGAGVRLTLAVGERPLAELLGAVASALSTPVAADEAGLAAAARALKSLASAPLDAPALVPIARCTAQAAVLAKEARVSLEESAGAERVESWRQAGFSVERTSIAAVGTADHAQSVLDALESTAGWPQAPAAEEPPIEETHGAYLTTSLAPGRAALEVAMWTGDALAAVGASERLAGSSALGARLAALLLPWRIEQTSATALPRGGCLRLRLVPDVGIDDQAKLALSAAEVLAEVRRELDRQLRLKTDPFVVTRDIIALGRAQDAAERAAWWTLTTPVQRSSIVVSALAASADQQSSEHPRPAAEGEVDGDSRLAAQYRKAVDAAPAVAGQTTIAERRHAVEQGQGQIWVMVANPCALLHEGLWDAGTTALSALTVAAQARPSVRSPSAVTVDPWVSGSGAGLIAHSGLARGDETGDQLARRVGRAAGRAYAQLPRDEAALVDAKRTVLAQLGGPLSSAFFDAAEHLTPNHPSWLAPWGSPSGQAAISFADVRSRWAEILRGPARIAVLANVDERQAAIAAREVDHWLLPSARARKCSETARPEPPQIGQHVLSTSAGGPATVLVATLAGTSSADRSRARLFEAALDGDDGLLARALAGTSSSFRIRLVGGERQAALVLALSMPAGQLASAKKAVLELLARLSAGGLGEAEHSRASRRATARRSSALAEPAARLESVWRGPEAEVEPNREEANRWARDHLRNDQLVLVGPGK